MHIQGPKYEHVLPGPVAFDTLIHTLLNVLLSALHVPAPLAKYSVHPDTNCVSYTFDQEWTNAKDLFSAGHIRDPSINQPGILKVFGPEEGTYSVS